MQQSHANALKLHHLAALASDGLTAPRYSIDRMIINIVQIRTTVRRTDDDTVNDQHVTVVPPATLGPVSNRLLPRPEQSFSDTRAGADIAAFAPIRRVLSETTTCASMTAL